MRLRRSFALILIMSGLLLSAGSLLANESASQNPSPSPRKASNPPQEHAAPREQTPQPDQRGTEQEPIVIKVLPSPKSQEETAREAEDREKKSSAERWMLIFTGVLAVAALFQFLWTTRQLVWMRRTTQSAQANATAALEQAMAIKLAERAYVRMFHVDPGMRFAENKTVRWCTVEIKVENCGSTPATVTDVRLNLLTAFEWDEPWPVFPDYGNEPPDETYHGFLVTGAHFLVTKTFQLGPKMVPDPQAGARRLCLVGYIDYIDVFRQRHRAGYAMEYRPHFAGNNLFFVTQPNYNYDCERKKGEGNDWPDA